MKVALIFRKKQHVFFSIEKIFGCILPYLEKHVAIGQHFLPHHTRGIGRVARNILYARSIRGADVFHVTGDIHYAVLGLPRSKTILTIHDCVFLYNYTGIKRKLLKWLLLDMPVRGARMVTTISEKSKAEIIRFSKCHPDKIVVIGNPVNENIYFSHREFNTGQPNVLFIGSTPNKNLERVIAALKGMMCHLEIIGIISEMQRSMLDQSGFTYSLHHGLSELAVADLYAACDIVMFPSTYEGFGLPVIEGQKAGRVVITSNISPMKEVAGNGACLVDPMNEQSIRHAFEKVVHDAAYREKLVAEGLLNIKKYEAPEIAGQYARLYSNIAENQS